MIPERPASLVAIPRLTTARLLLRELRMSDFDAYAESMADPITTRFLSGVSDRRTAWRMFASATGAWLLNGAGWWAVCRNDTGEIVGVVGAFFRDSSPDLEIGWILFRSHWGQGFASEAAAAALRFARDTHEPKRIVALIDARNVASARVSERLGMRYECDVDFYGETVGRYLLAAQ